MYPRPRGWYSIAGIAWYYVPPQEREKEKISKRGANSGEPNDYGLQIFTSWSRLSEPK